MRLTELATYRTPLQPNVYLVAVRSDDGQSGLGETFWGAPTVEAYLHETAAPVLASIDDHSPAASGEALRPYAGFDGSGAEMRVSLASWYPEIVEGLPTVSDGRVEVSSTPGLGLTLREDFIARPDTIVRTSALV